jgi:predicted aldo/keto reductase-like oxidoreductase
MKTRILGRTGLEVSAVGFGGIPIQGVAEAEAHAVVRAALDAGITFFDSARGYTDSEAKLGRALAGAGDRIAVATKTMARTAAAMAADIETSLRNLGRDAVDLYQMHNVASKEILDQVLGPGGAYEAMARARRDGKIRFVGVTGHSREALLRAVETDLFDTVQHPYNPLEAEWRSDVIPAARARGLGVIGMKPAAGGALRDVPAALRFALHDGVDVAIPGMDAVAQVVENAAAGAALDPPTRADLAAFAEEARRWGGRFCRRCGYCKPCKNGLDVPFLLLIEAYYTRYDLKGWALERLAGLEKKYADCAACGECAERCPYGLPIPELLAAAAAKVV